MEGLGRDNSLDVHCACPPPLPPSCTSHYTFYIIPHTIYILHCTSYIILSIIHYTVPYCTATCRTPHYTLYIVQCTLYIILSLSRCISHTHVSKLCALNKCVGGAHSFTLLALLKVTSDTDAVVNTNSLCLYIMDLSIVLHMPRTKIMGRECSKSTRWPLCLISGGWSGY